jgi:hypothetical protein
LYHLTFDWGSALIPSVGNGTLAILAEWRIHLRHLREISERERNAVNPRGDRSKTRHLNAQIHNDTDVEDHLGISVTLKNISPAAHDEPMRLQTDVESRKGTELRDKPKPLLACRRNQTRRVTREADSRPPL